MMWSYQELLNQENGTNDTPPSKICGIKCTSSAQPPNQFINSDELDAIFYDDESDFEPFMVNAGSSIGSFNVGEFGVDIFLGGLAFKPTFEMARGSKNTLQIDLSTNTSPASKLSKTYSNQRIFNFIDPCAFYGLFFHNGVEVKFQPTDTSFQLLKESGLYESLLEKFFNKDVVYVDLRNEHNYAFDLYQNFSDPINITVDDGNVTSYPYGDPLPMISLHSSNFSENGSSGKIIFNLPKGDHFYSKVFLGQGFYQEYYPEVKKKLKDIEFFGDYSEDIEISIPKNSAGDIIPCHINLRYIKKVVDPPPVQAPLTIEAHYYLDNLFDLKRLLNEDGSLSIPPSISGNCKWNILHDDVFVDESSGHSEGYMAKVGIAEDNNSIYLFTFINGEDLSVGSVEMPFITGGSSSVNFITDELLPRFSGILSIERKDIVDSNNNLFSALIDNMPEEVGNGQKLVPSPENLILLAFDKDSDFASIVNSFLQIPSGHSCRLAIRNVVELNDIDGNPYLRGDFFVEGHSNNGDILLIDTTIKFYQI